jgi:hypothetical protein
MRCLFCRENSDLSRSVEHIIPESLGNTEHVLPPRVVCDKCNNYFARKVEAPLLDSEFFRHVRQQAMLQNKRGRIPTVTGLCLPAKVAVLLSVEKNGSKGLCAAKDDETGRLIESIRLHQKGTLLVPVPVPPEQRIVSRFLGKVALEVLASRVFHVAGGLDEIVDKEELHPLRRYARRGDKPQNWPFHERRIYPEDAYFVDRDTGEYYEVLHEYTLLYTEHTELYLVLGLLGVEYTLNMVEPMSEGYEQWLRENGGRSPLYPDGFPPMYRPMQQPG